MNIETYLMKREALLKRIREFDQPITNPMFGELNKAAKEQVVKFKKQLKQLDKEIGISHENP